MEPFNWTCPYCGHHSVVSNGNCSNEFSHILTDRSHHKNCALEHEAIACTNPKCTKLALVIRLRATAKNAFDDWILADTIQEWKLMPRSRSKPQPDYIPEALRKDYEEACLILNDSPKASATMSRRCLQGIVRDFWDIPLNKRGNLGAELSFIKDRVEPSTWETITTIREVGDIGAHMEKDVNFVVDVEPDEASLLLELIEALFQDWYVARASRLARDQRVRDIATKKLDEKKAAAKQAKAVAKPQSGDEADT